MTDELKPTIKERAIRAVRDLVVSMEQMDEDELAHIRATPQAALLREWIAKGDPDTIKRKARREALEEAYQAVVGYCREMNRLGKEGSFTDVTTAIRALSEGTNQTDVAAVAT